MEQEQQEQLVAGYQQQLDVMKQQLEQQRLAIGHLATLLEEQRKWRDEDKARQAENDADFDRRMADQRDAQARAEARVQEQMEMHKASLRFGERQAIALEKIAEALAH